MTDTMRAARHTCGGPDVLVIEQAAKPSPGREQVLVRIQAASVNPIDWKLREGMLKDFIPLQLHGSRDTMVAVTIGLVSVTFIVGLNRRKGARGLSWQARRTLA